MFNDVNYHKIKVVKYTKDNIREQIRILISRTDQVFIKEELP